MKNITLTDDNITNLTLFKELLDKDENTIINEALEEYFLNAQTILLEKKLEAEKALTNLSYDEFWDDLEI